MINGEVFFENKVANHYGNEKIYTCCNRTYQRKFAQRKCFKHHKCGKQNNEKAPITLKLNKKIAYSLKELSVCVLSSFFIMAAPVVFRMA